LADLVLVEGEWASEAAPASTALSALPTDDAMSAAERTLGRCFFTYAVILSYV
jgi:hypothetical protein